MQHNSNSTAIKHPIHINPRLAAFVACLLCLAAADAQSLGHPRFSLTLGNAAGYGVSRDLGTSPRVYDALSVGQSVAFNAETVDWTFSGLFAARGILNTSKIKHLLKNGSYSGYGGSAEVGIAARRRVWQNNEASWSIAVGGGLSNYTYIGYASKFMNASFSLSDLFQPDIIFRVQYDLPNANSLAVLPGWFSAYASLSLAPFGLAYRPGFSFIDNYTGAREQKDYLFSSFRTSFAWLPHLATELGVRFNLRSGNRIALAYRWDYRSSHGTGDWQYDEVNHQLLLEFNILLKK